MLYTVKKDKEYKKIVKDIFRNTEFKKIYNIEQFKGFEQDEYPCYPFREPLVWCESGRANPANITFFEPD